MTARVTCRCVYRFLLAPRWAALCLVMTLAAAGMVALGLWQLDRYHHRSEINARIDAASVAAPSPLTSVLSAPTGPAGTVGMAPPASAGWLRVVVTGRYDPAHEILARGRTVNGRVGFEVITPLVLADGSSVLVDRGWVPPAEGGAGAAPTVPAAPAGEVTVVGRVHQPESGARPPDEFGGRPGGQLSVRRIAPERLAPALPYPIYGAYLTLESQTPPADPGLVTIGPNYENAAMNAGYVVQWWVFATLTLAGLCFLIVREGRARKAGTGREAASPSSGAVA